MIIKFFKDFFIGLKAYYEAFVLIFQYNLWLYFLIPVTLSVLLFVLSNELLIDLDHVNFNELISKIDLKKELGGFKFQGMPTDGEELKLLFESLKLIVVIIAIKMNKYVVLALMSPVNTFLSARVEKILTGNTYPFDFQQLISDIYRGINFVVRNLFRQMMFIAGWYVITVIFPQLEFLSFTVVFIIGAYFYGASLMDYTNERKKLSLEQSITFIKAHAGIALAIGSVFSALFFTSYVGIVFAPVPGVIAATIAIDKKVGLKRAKLPVPQNKKEESSGGNKPKK